MSSNYDLDRPRTLLPTHQVSDFSRNFAQLEKHAKQPYSLVKVVRALSTKPSRLDGFEHEVDQELKSLNPTRNATGILVPIEALAVSRRDLTVTGLPQVIQTSVVDEIIPFLRVKTVCGRCGATLLDGLSGANLSLPRAYATAGAGWYGELGPIPSADQSLDNVTLVPKLIAGSTIVSNQLIRQSSPDIEAFIVRDISDAIAVQVDQAALFGAGSATVPKGIMSYAANAVGSYTYGLRSANQTFGGPATWASILGFEKTLEDGRIENDGTFAYVSSSATRTKWQAAQKATNYPVYLWEQENDELDGRVNGRKAVSSAQITGDIVILGKFSEMLIGTWLGIELNVNPNSRAINAETVILATLLVDVGFRYPLAFCCSSDSGAQ
jgi:HK97 family phage major capsid protein